MTAHYNKIESSNNIDFAVTAITSSQYGLMLCRFKPNEAAGDMTRIKGLARGYGIHIPDDPEYGFYLYIWNSNSSQWEYLAGHTSSSNQTIYGSKTANLTNYVDGSGFIYFLVSSPACADEGELAVDYAACEITYTEDKYGAELYIRNFNSSSWELLDSHTNSSDTTISGTRTSSISNYLDGSNYVMLLAYQKYATPTGETGHIYSDYAECEITYISGAGGENDNTYTYDVDLKRIKKDVDGTVQKFIYDGPNVVVEYDGNDSLLATYLTPGLDQNLTMIRNSATYYYHSDGLGSIRNLTDSSEVAQNTYDYYAFGSVVGSPTENVTNDYRFTGRRWDSESSLYYYRARMYAPTFGRFTSRTWISQGNTGVYPYALNNPLNASDPTGNANMVMFRTNNPSGGVRADWIIPGVLYGETWCEPDKGGKIEKKEHIEFHPCEQKRCIKVHEMRHILDMDYCCRNYGKCYMRKPSNKKLCDAYWYMWVNVNRHWLECRAWHDTKRCLTFWSDQAQKNRDTYCCYLLTGLALEAGRIEWYHCSRVSIHHPWKCPFNRRGDIIPLQE